MSLNPGGVGGAVDHPVAAEAIDRLVPAYLATYRGPHGGAPGTEAAVTGPVRRPGGDSLNSAGLVEAQLRLGGQRSPGATRVAVYTADEPGGFGPALQIVTDNSAMIMDSVTVLLHRLGVAYKAIMNPMFRVRRGPGGELLDIVPASEATFSDGVVETWVHVQLASSVDRRALAEAEELLPRVLADTRQVALDSTDMAAALRILAAELDGDSGKRFPSPDRKDVAALLRWLADAHFVLLGYQRCPVRNGEATVDTSSRLGVLRLR
ncbi:NAD-glutamate dehydrogenase, partial [Mycobacterium sp. ITM-2017-0098]